MTTLAPPLHPAKAGERRLPWRIVALALAAIALLVLATAARAQAFPKLTGLVVDAANVLPPDRKAALTAKLEAFQEKTGRQLVVATVPTLGGEDVQQYGVALLRAWGVGLKGANNGTILLVAPAERKVGIETGYGVEGVLTDAYSSVIIQTKILPAFKAGDIPGGIDAGADAIIGLLSQPDDEARAKRDAAVAAWNKAHARQGGGGVPWGIVFWLFVIGFVVLSGLRRRGTPYAGGGAGGVLGNVLMWSALDAMSDRRGGWGDGGSFGGGGSSDGGGWMGGGFTGGGGGSGGGGGASGSW